MKTQISLFVAIFALAAAQSVQATVIDMGGASTNITNLGGYEYNGTAIKNNVLTNGTLNVTKNQEFADGTFTFGSGLTLNQTSDRWGISGGRTVKLMDGARLNYTSQYNAYIGRLENGTTYNGTTQLILDNGTVDFSKAAILFTPKASNSYNNKNVVLNFTMINGSSLTTPNDKDMKLGAVDVESSKKHTTEKLTVAVTNSTLSVGKIIFGSSANNLSDQDHSYINASFGPGADITCKQFYADSYPKSTIKFDGAVAHTAASVESDFFGTPSSSTFDGYELLAGGVTIDVTNSFEHGENFAPLFGVGGLTKTGSGTLTYNRDAFKFTGPLTVSDGTFVSSQNMAASAFNVDGSSSILNLSDATLTNATVSLSATAGGTLTLAGATITDSAPDLMLAGGGTTDYFTRDSAVGTYTLDSLTLGEGVTLSLTGGGLGVDEVSVNTLVLSATAANKVALDFSDAANIAPGTYNILAITGGGTFASGDEAKFALDANAPKGSTLSVSGASLVLSVPASNPAMWTGGANDGKFSTPGNWLGGAVPGVSDDVVISVASETTLVCDVALNVNSITFPATSAKVTIEGAGCITNATTIVNYSAARPVIDVPVEFVSGDAYAPIDVTGEVDFSGGVKGTLPANHSKFYGNYTLTANEWTLTSAITLAENATVTASDLEITISTQDSKYLCAEAGASLCLKKIKTTQKGDIFGTYSGDLQAKNITIDTGGSNSSSFKFGENFKGTLTVGELRNYPGTGHVYAFPRVKDIVFDGSNGASDNGLRSRRGGFCLGAIDGSSSGDEFIMRSSANWIFQVENGNDYSFFIKLSASHVGIDTSDYAGVGTGHTVTFVNNGNNHGANGKAKLLEGDGSSDLSLFGNGRVNFQNTANFTGGLIASNSVTLAVDKDVYPGKGNVTFRDTATFSLVGSASGTVPVAGTLTMAGGTTIHIPTYIVGVLPLSVNALAFDSVTDVSKVVLNIEGGTLETGYYPIIGSTTTLPEGAENNFALSLGEGVVLPESTSASLCVEGNVIYLLVGDGQGLRSGVWSGRGGDNKLSNPANWENITVPSAGDALDFSGVTSAATVNGDMNATFGAVTMGDKEITFTGSFTAASFSDRTKVAVGKDSMVTLDGDLEFSGSSDVYIVGSVEQGGRFVVNGDIIASNAFTGSNVYQCKSYKGGAVVAKGLVCNATGSEQWPFRLAAYEDDKTANWIVGADGLSGSKNFFALYNPKRKASIQPLDSDFTIATSIGVRAPLTLNTTGYDGSPHLITIGDSAGNGGIIRDGLVTITGSGTVVANYDATKLHDNRTNPFVVTNTATLALMPGSNLGTGLVTVNDSSTLQVAESAVSKDAVAVTLGGNLTLKAGAALGFNYTTRNAPVLDLNDKTVTFDEGPTTNVVVKISATAGKHAKSGKNVLTAGGKFAGVTATLGAGAPDWALGVDVVNGEIVLDVKPMPTLIIIR